MLSEIATGMISAAVMLEQKVVSKLRLNREKELAATSANAEVTGEENPLDAALAAFKRAA